MTIRTRVRSARTLLVIIFIVSALLWSATLFVAVRPLNIIAAAVCALIALAAFAWRDRFAWSADRVALWIEEHTPRLRYVLVTAMDPRVGHMVERDADALMVDVPVRRYVTRTATRSLLPAVLALVVTVVLFTLFPPGSAIAKIVPPHLSSGKPVANRLAVLKATLTPPAYTGWSDKTLDNPTTITALRGTRVELRGIEDYRYELTVKDSLPSLLTLEDRGYTRQIIVEPVIDQAPTVELRAPLRDTTLRVISGNVHLAAEFVDDIGGGRARFEYIVTSGSDESFSFREGSLGARNFGRAKDGRFEITVTLKSFELMEGDQLSLRAVVWDNNNVASEPGKGVSETRWIRIARKEEYDSLNLNRAPPSADTAMMSLRMLIIATQKLIKQQPKMKRLDFIAESQKLGQQSETIRRKIQQIIDETTEGGLIAPDTLLTTALDAMYEASRELFIASPQTALPPMFRAYKALQALRNAKRYYIRGLQQPIIVNIDRVRLAGGTDTGHATARLPRTIEPSVLEKLRVSYARAVQFLAKAQATRATGGVADSAMTALMEMRVATLVQAPKIATAVAEVIGALQRGKDATGPLLLTRRLLESTTMKLDSLPAWSGAWQP